MYIEFVKGGQWAKWILKIHLIYNYRLWISYASIISLINNYMYVLVAIPPFIKSRVWG